MQNNNRRLYRIARGVGAIKQIGDTIGRMSEISSTIASAVEEQGAATKEIARNCARHYDGVVKYR